MGHWATLPIWCKPHHTLSLGIDTPKQTRMQQFFSVPPGTEKVSKPPKHENLICCTCHTISIILISEQPANKSQSSYSSDLTDSKCHRTKH